MANTGNKTAQQDEWATVSTPEDLDQEPETKITFDIQGDEYIGIYLGTRTVPGNTGAYTQYRFRDDDGTLRFLNPLASLNEPMRKVRSGSRVRLAYVADRDTGRDSLMKIIRVDVARKSSGGNRSTAEPPF